DGDALALSAAESSTAFADEGVIGLREFHDEIVREGRLGRGDHTFLGNIVQAVADVVPHGVVKQYIFLGDHGNLLAQGFDGDAANVQTIDADGAGSGLVETRKQVD